MRFRLLLLAIACVLGRAIADDGFDKPGPGSPRAFAEDTGEDWSDASSNGARVFAEEPGGEPIALLKGRIVILKPSRLAFRIPQAWLDRYDAPPAYPFPNMRETASDPKELDRRYAPKDNLHFTRQDLENGKSGEGNEWDVTFARLVNDILPFDNCVFHGGGEGWGLQGHSFADLQMRVFVGSWGPDAIPKLVQDRVSPGCAENVKRRFHDGIACRRLAGTFHQGRLAR